MCKKKEKVIEKSFDIGGSLAGSLAGATVGAVAGPLGIVAGALLGTAAEQAIIVVGNEIKDRILSKRESQRVGIVYQIAGEKINANIEAGKLIRDDGFFEDEEGNRAPGEEILEGILLVAQREYEEKKLKYLGNLYANIVFEKEISPQNANALIKVAESLTYRQLCAIRVIVLFQDLPANQLKKTAYRRVSGTNNISIVSEIFDLYQKSLLGSSDAILSAAGINPSKLRVVGNGAWLYKLMELHTIPRDDLLEIIEVLTGKTIPKTAEAREDIVDGEAKAAAVFT